MDYNITDYGATPASATAGINAAALAASTAGGGTVFIPPGTWTITTTVTPAIRIYPGVSFSGAGKGLSIIKVADAQPDYVSIFGHVGGEPLNHFSLCDLTIDYNGANNPIVADPVATNKARFALLGVGSNDVTVERCRFINVAAVNVIAFFQSSSNVRILNNDFELIGVNPTIYDHSTVYANEGPHIEIRGNRFIGVLGSKMARTAIETHGDYQIVTDNIIANYWVGMNICGTGTPSSEGLIVSHNVLMDVRTGIELWGAYFGANVSDPAIRNAQIVHNNITINSDAAPGTSTGIVLWSGVAQIDNLLISSNIIRLKPYTYAGVAFDNLHAGGITAYLAPGSRPTAPNRNWRIVDNLIDGAHSSGILIGLKINGLEVSRNTVVNPAQLGAIIQSDQKAGIWIDGIDTTDLIMDANIIRDTRTTPLINAGVRISTGLNGGRIFDTYISSAGNTAIADVSVGNVQVR